MGKYYNAKFYIVIMIIYSYVSFYCYRAYYIALKPIISEGKNISMLIFGMINCASGPFIAYFDYRSVPHEVCTILFVIG